MKELRCPYCNKLLAENFSGEILIKCSRCKKYVMLTRNKEFDSVK